MNKPAEAAMEEQEASDDNSTYAGEASSLSTDDLRGVPSPIANFEVALPCPDIAGGGPDDQPTTYHDKLRSSHPCRRTIEELESISLTKPLARQHSAAYNTEETAATSATTWPVAVAVAPSSQILRHHLSPYRSQDLSLSSSASSNPLERPSLDGCSTSISLITSGATVEITTQQKSAVCCTLTATATSMDEIPMIHAELAADDEVPIMIQAEPVPEPTQAFEVVTPANAITEGASTSILQHQVQEVQVEGDFHGGTNMEQGHSVRHVPPGTSPFPIEEVDDETSISKMKEFYTKNSRWIGQCQVLLLIIGLILAIVVPRMAAQRNTSSNGSKSLLDPVEELDDDDMSWPAPTSAGDDDFDLVADILTGITTGLFPTTVTKAPTPAPSSETIYPFDCYLSTLDIALAQVEMMNQVNVIAHDEFIVNDDRIFVLCPYTTIFVGHLDPDDRKIKKGDYPLTALMDSVEIRCGQDGNPEQHCVIDGGFLQVLLNPSLPEPLGDATVNRTDNVVFRGITFTGALEDTSLTGLGIGGVSVFANNPGTNVTFIDCSWEDMIAPQGLVRVGGQSSSSWSFGPTTDVVFENCAFFNITYDGGPLLGVFGQGLTLRGSRFQNISLPNTSISKCSIEVLDLDWCHGLVYCVDDSSCEFEDICVQDLEYAGPAAIAVTSSKTNLTVSGAKHIVGLKERSTIIDIEETCPTGFAQFQDATSSQVDCLKVAANWTSSDNASCLL